MNRTRSVAGYTLVEVLIALALSVVLLTCVYGSLRVYWQLTNAGRMQVEQAQLSRAIVRRMEVDLASLVFVEPDDSDSSSGQAADSSSSSGSSSRDSSSSAGSSGSGGGAGSGSGAGTGGGTGAGDSSGSGSGSGGSGSSGGSSSSGSSTNSSSNSSQSQATSSTTATVGTSVGLTGDASTLLLHISRPARDLDYSAMGGGASLTDRLSDLQSVSYFLAAPGAGGLAGAVGDRVNDRANPQKVAGLARLEGDQMSIDFADSQSNVASMAEAAEIIAPEIAALQFRYFDGSTWYDSWNSTETARLPLAIEVTMGFQLPDNTQDPRERRRSTEPEIGRTIRQVIAVPMAVPYVPGVTD